MSDNTLVQIALTAGIVILMIPGLLIEPGPLSEIAGIGAIFAIWGFDFPGGNS